MIICHDLRHPELARLAVAAGAQIIFVANNESGLHFENKLLGYRSMQISRATENMVYAVICNAAADLEDMRRPDCSHGNSMIVDPLGNVLAEAGSFEQGLVTATLDLRTADRSAVLRTLNQSKRTRQLYATDGDNPAYTQWVKSGLKLVRRLDER